MKIIFDHQECALPADWLLHIRTWEDGYYRLFVQRPGSERLWPLSEAVWIAELETTSSNKHNRMPVK